MYISHKVMSLVSASVGGGAAGQGAGVAAPRFVVGGYAEWKPAMVAYAMRMRVSDALSSEIPEWDRLVERVREWEREKRTSTIAAALGAGQVPVPRGNAAAGGAPEEGRAAAMAVREAAREIVYNSERLYAVIYDALYAELRPQVAHIPAGYAYGLWVWLERKFQSTEIDNIAMLLTEWMSMSMNDGEEYDAYRARVNKVYSLLEIAKERPSARQYVHVMLDRLPSTYRQAVLALKAGGRLDKADEIKWDDIATFINGHLRAMIRDDTKTGSELAMVTRGGAAPGEQQTERKRETQGRGGVQCWRCEQYGHIARFCPSPSAARSRPGDVVERQQRETREHVSAVRGASHVHDNSSSHDDAYDDDHASGEAGEGEGGFGRAF